MPKKIRYQTYTERLCCDPKQDLVMSKGHRRIGICRHCYQGYVEVYTMDAAGDSDLVWKPIHDVYPEYQ